MAERIFRRKIYEQMLNWKQNQHGTTALLIRGARRVGKSTVAEEFARREYESYMLVDFSKATPAIHRLFEDVSNLDYIFTQLQLNYRKSLKPRKSVIIFDEIQKQPLARQAIKTLVADGRSSMGVAESTSTASTATKPYTRKRMRQSRPSMGRPPVAPQAARSGATNEAMALTNWPKVSVGVSWRPVTMSDTRGLSDVCMSVLPMPSSEKATSMRA